MLRKKMTKRQILWAGLSFFFLTAAAVTAEYILIFTHLLPSMVDVILRSTGQSAVNVVQGIVGKIILALSVWVLLYFVFLGLLIWQLTSRSTEHRANK